MRSNFNKTLVLFLFVFFPATGLFAQKLSEGYTIIHYPAIPSEYSPLHNKVEETSGLIY